MRIKIFITISIICALPNLAEAQLKKFGQIKMEGPAFDTVMATLTQSLPIFINGNNINKDVGANVQFSCIIIPFSPGVRSTHLFKEGAANKYNGRSMAWLGQKSIKDMLQWVYGRQWTRDTITRVQYAPVQIPESRVMFTADVDTASLVSFYNGVYMRGNGHTAQLTSSQKLSHLQMAKYLASAIELQFGLNCTWVKQTKKCIVFKPSGTPIPKYSNGPVESRLGKLPDNNFIFKFNRQPFQHILDRLQDYYRLTNYPLVNETNFNEYLGMVDFTIQNPELSYDDLKETMAKFGVAVCIEDRIVDVLVIGKAN